jgi:hypothetical protein
LFKRVRPASEIRSVKPMFAVGVLFCIEFVRRLGVDDCEKFSSPQIALTKIRR